VTEPELPEIPPTEATAVRRRGRRRGLARTASDPRLVGLAVVVVLVLVTALVGGTAHAPRLRSTVGRTVALASSTLVCPQVGGADTAAGAASRVGYAASDIGDPVDQGTPPADTATKLISTPLQDTDPPMTVGVLPGHAWVVDGDDTVTPLRLDITGPAATYVGATEFDRTVVGTEVQAAATECGAPTTDAWFAGFSSAVGATAELFLTDVDTVPAVVNVEMWGDSAAPDTTSTVGIKVDPGAQVAVHLDQRDPGLSNMVAHVVTSQGRIVPAVLSTTVNGSVPTGTDWVPTTAAPALVQTVPGIAGGPGGRDLIIADPGDLDATVSINLVTPDSAYTPTDLSQVAVGAGTVVRVPLDNDLQGDPAAAVVTSTAPVVVGGSSTRQPDSTGATDFALTPATGPVTGATLVSGTEVSDARHTVLLLSAPGADAQLTLTQLPYTATTPPVSERVTVPGGTTVQISLATFGADDPGPGVLVSPDGGGPLFGSWLITEAGPTDSAGDITELPMRTPVRSRYQPPVQQRLTVGLP
jgi:hypothetical protein